MSVSLIWEMRRTQIPAQLYVWPCRWFIYMAIGKWQCLSKAQLQLKRSINIGLQTRQQRKALVFSYDNEIGNNKQVKIYHSILK